MFRPALLAIFLFLSQVPGAAHAGRPVGNTRVLADVKAVVPFPEGIAVSGGRAYVSGPAVFPTAGQPPSRIGVYDVRTGALLETFTIKGQELSQEHALSSLTLDGEGRLYVIDTQQGVLRIDPRTGAQERYSSPFPVLGEGPPALPNDLTFDEAGWLYVSDSFQGAIWRIPPGGGAPRLWFRSPELATGPFQFGANGLRVHPKRKELWFAHTQSGVLYALPLVDAPKQSELRRVYRFAEGSGPDGLAFGRSGNLYVTLAFANQVAVLTPHGEGFQEARLGGGEPWDAPANIAFTGRGTMLVTNHAIVSRRAESFLLLDVEVKEQAEPQARPRVP